MLVTETPPELLIAETDMTAAASSGSIRLFYLPLACACAGSGFRNGSKIPNRSLQDQFFGFCVIGALAIFANMAVSVALCASCGLAGCAFVFTAYCFVGFATP